MNRSVDDSALLQQPIQTAAQGVASVVGYWQKSTSEVKNLLANECEIILECRFCRSFYRTIRDFLSHKRQYCRTLLIQPNSKASKAAVEIVEQARTQIANETFAKEAKIGSEGLTKSAKKAKNKCSDSTKSKHNAHYAFSLPPSSEKMDLTNMPRLSKPPSAAESDDEQIAMPQLTMEEKLPADRVAIVPERSLRSKRSNLRQKSEDPKESTMTKAAVLTRLHKYIPSVVDTAALKCLHKGCKDKNPFPSLFVLASHATLKHNCRSPSSNSMSCFVCGEHFHRYKSIVDHVKDAHEEYCMENLSSRSFESEDKEMKRGKRIRLNKESNSSHSRSLSPAVNDAVVYEDASESDDMEEAPKLEMMRSDYCLEMNDRNNERSDDTEDSGLTGKPIEDSISTITNSESSHANEEIEGDFEEVIDSNDMKKESEELPLTFEEEIKMCVEHLVCEVISNGPSICSHADVESVDEKSGDVELQVREIKSREGESEVMKTEDVEIEKNSKKQEGHEKSEEERESIDSEVKEKKVRKRVNPVWLNEYRQKMNEERLRRQQESLERKNLRAARASKKPVKVHLTGKNQLKPVVEAQHEDADKAKIPKNDWDVSGEESDHLSEKKPLVLKKKEDYLKKEGSDEDENEDSIQSDEEQVGAVHETNSRPSRKRRKPNWIDDNDYVTTEFRKKYSRRSGASDNGGNANTSSEYDQTEPVSLYRRGVREGSLNDANQSLAFSVKASIDAPESSKSSRRVDGPNAFPKTSQSEVLTRKTLHKNYKSSSPESFTDRSSGLPESVVLPASQYATPAKQSESSSDPAQNKKRTNKELRLHYTPRARKLKFGDTQTETLKEASDAFTSEVTASPNSRRKQNLSKLGEGDDVTIVSFPNGRPPPCPQDLSSIPVYLTEMQRELFFSFIRPVSSSTDGAHKCMQCGQIVTSMVEGRRHAVGHLRIMRLRCALCDCGSFFCSDMRTHLQMRHCEMLHRAPKGYVLEGDVTPCMDDAQADELTKLVDPMKPGRVMYTSGKIVSAASHIPYYPDAEIEERVLGAARPAVLGGNTQKSASPAPKEISEC